MSEITLEKTREHPFYKWLIANMTLNEAVDLFNRGWSTQEEHCLYVASSDLVIKHRNKIAKKLTGNWYLSDSQEETK